MAIRTKWFLILPALIGGTATACGDGASVDTKANASWSTAERRVDYRVEESASNEKRSFDLKLDFKGSAVDVVELDSAVSAKMDGSGRLTYALGESRPPVIYELIALSVLPPKGDALRVGHTWSYTRPDDAAASASKGIVAQERFDYEVTAVDADKISVDVRGFLRIAPSAGLNDALTKNGMPAAAATLLGSYKPYVVGTAEFDRGSGETLRASGRRVPFAFLTEGAAIEPETAAIQYSLTHQ